MKRRLSKTSAMVEGLESRQLLSATVVGTPTIANATKLVGPQSNPQITINPNNPAELFVASRNDLQSIFLGHSVDSGATWTGKAMFGAGSGFAQATGVPSISMDKFGNLFVAYTALTNHTTQVLMSYDHGATFHLIGSFPTLNGDPQVSTGAGSVWVTLNQVGGADAGKKQLDAGAVDYGATVYGLGRVKPFKAELVAGPQSTITSAAVAPRGRRTVVYTFEDRQRTPSRSIRLSGSRWPGSPGIHADVNAGVVAGWRRRVSAGLFPRRHRSEPFHRV